MLDIAGALAPVRFVVGVDQSPNHSGVCVLSTMGDIHFLGLIEPGKRKEDERLAYIRDSLVQILGTMRYATGVLEGYSYSSLNKKFLLGEVGAVVKLALHDVCDASYVVAPKQLKRFVTGRGGADKAKVMQCIEKQWNIAIDDDNLADAYGLARIAYELAAPGSVIRHQLDVVNKLRKAAQPQPKRRLAPKNKAFKDAL